MDIKNSIVAILDKKKKIIGTGFVVGENLILTCAHVVETATSTIIDPTTDLNVQVTVRFAIDGSEAIAQVDARNSSPGYEKDVALLRVDTLPQGAEPLPLAPTAGSAGHDFYAYGYATVINVQGIGARGKIVDIVDSDRLVQLTSQEPDHGMSGGPVLDEQRRVVIGMITKGKGLLEKDQNLRNTQTTFATSTQVIFEVCHDLEIADSWGDVENYHLYDIDFIKLMEVDSVKLRKAMYKVYSRSEFERLLNDNSLGYDDLPEGVLENKIMSCITWFRRRQYYDKLVFQVLQEHPELKDDLL
jgi:hypothetical protein